MKQYDPTKFSPDNINADGSDSEESGYFVPPPKAPITRKILDPKLKQTIVYMLKDIMVDFDEQYGQCDYVEYERVMKFVPVYQEIPVYYQRSFEDKKLKEYYSKEIQTQYTDENPYAL